MENLKKAVRYFILVTGINLAVSATIFYLKGRPEFMGYLVGTVVNVVFVAIWYLGARKGIKANSLMLLLITVGGFPIRLGILILFAFGGLYLFQMNTIYFAIAFLVGTIFSLVIEVWFFNTLKFPTTKHIK
ncbi:MAG TPA: hypothetical protein PKY31_03475 [Spirochaetota bacterium]|nr:hypothetical protein [Spirochaetota bacterium]